MGVYARRGGKGKEEEEEEEEGRESACLHTCLLSLALSLIHSHSLSLPPWKVCMLVMLSLSLLLLLLLLSPPFSSTFSSLFLSLIMDGGGIGEEGGRRGGGERERERGGEREWRTSKGEQRGVALKGRGVLHMYVLYYIYIAAVGRERERGEGEKGRRREGAEIILTHSLFPPSFLPPSLHLHTHTHTLCSISHLVDPASSHMLSSKAKPCMSKYKGFCPKLRTAHYNGRNLNGPIPFPSRITLGI